MNPTMQRLARQRERLADEATKKPPAAETHRLVIEDGGQASFSPYRTSRPTPASVRATPTPTPKPDTRTTPMAAYAQTQHPTATRAGIEEYLLHRANPARHPLNGPGRDFMGRTLIDLARESLRRSGQRVEGLDRMELAQRAMHGTSDFSAILANVASKTLRAAYEAAPRTFTAWAKQSSAQDFKPVSRAQLGDAPMLKQVTEHGEFTYGTISDHGETYSLATYGRIVGITRKAIVNDDMGAFDRLIPAFGRAAAELEGDIVYGVLSANAAMADGVELFHADHGNLIDPGATISVDSLGAARAAMRKQTGDQGSYLNISPRFLIVPAELETLANQFTSNAYQASASGNINPFSTTLIPITEPRLSAHSAAAWYLAADPNQVDTVEYAYLEGSEGVFIDQQVQFNSDGIAFKARLDFAAKAIDWRGIIKNAGE